MKAHCSNRSAFAGLSARFLSTLAGCAVLGACLFSAAVPSARAANAPDRILVAGWVEVAKPVSGATVRLVGLDGKLLAAAKNPSGVAGTFGVWVKGSLPVEFIAEARGGDLGEAVLRAYVHDFNPDRQMVFIDPATTLVVNLLKADGSLSEQDAEFRVDHFLGQSDGGNPALEMPSSDLESAYAAAEEAAGGKLPQFIARLEGQLKSDPDSAFVPAPRMMARGPSIPPEVGSMVVKEGKGFIGKLITDAAEQLGGPIGGKIAGGLLGWMFDAAGLNEKKTDPLQGIKDQLEAMTVYLQDIQDSLKVLGADVQDMTRRLGLQTTNSEYNVRVSTLQTSVLDDIDAALLEERYIAGALCAEKPEWDTINRERKNVATYCASLQRTAGSIPKQLLGTGYTTGLLRLFNQAVAGKKLFWSQASTAQVRENLNYWDMIQFTQLELIVENMRASNSDPVLIKTYINQFKENRVKEYNMAKIEPMPDFEVIQILSSTSGLAWYTTKATAMGKPALELSFLQIKPNFEAYDSNSWKPPTIDYGVWGSPQDGWRLPTTQDMEALIDANKRAGGTFTDWVSDQTGYGMGWDIDEVLSRLRDVDNAKKEYLNPKITAAKPMTPERKDAAELAVFKALQSRLKQTNGVESTITEDDNGNRFLLVSYFNFQDQSRWWTNGRKSEQDGNPNGDAVMRVYQINGDAKNRNWWWREDVLGTTVNVLYLNVSNGNIEKAPIGWVQDSGFYTSSPVYECQQVYRKKGDWGQVKSPEYEGRYRPQRAFYRYNGMESANWFSATAIAVRPVGAEEMKKYIEP